MNEDAADKQAEEIVKQLATVVGRFGALAQPVSNQIVAAALREAQAKIANLKAEAGSNHSLLNDVQAELNEARQQAEQAAERQREKDAEIVDAEPECPGDMPDEMFSLLRNDRDAMSEAIRASVRLTKRNIKSAILAQP